MMNKIDATTLITELNKASDAYYNSESPIMSDAEFDYKMDLLREWEEHSGCIFSNSPTQKVGASVLSSLNKVEITPKPMLSLEKCHSDVEVAEFANNQSMIAMVKLDGLSVRVKYNHGKLISANTRGNGVEGTDITEHIKQFQNVPLTIPDYNGEYIVDGEAIIKLSDFEEINKNGEFKNPRNAAAGALNVLDTKLVKDRKLSFIVWDVIVGYSSNFNYLSDKLEEAKLYGFEIVPYEFYPYYIKDEPETIDDINQELMALSDKYPCDGVVWKFDNYHYGDSLGATGHHFKNAIAWKPEVEVVETELLDIDWTMGRTGILTPVAVFKPVELDGSLVERASLHNVSVLNNTLHGRGWVGQKLKIYKANLIIPQILSAEEDDESIKDYINQPWICPICGEPLYEHGTDSITLVCENPSCSGKLINILDHFCGKKGLNIKGLSKATLEKLINWEWINNFSDIFELYNHANEWINKPGFGAKSVQNIISAISAAKEVSLEKFIAAIGIPLIGNNVAKEICKHITTYSEFRELIKSKFNFCLWDTFGSEKCLSLWNYDYTEADKVAEYLSFIEPEETSNDLKGLTIVITGTLKEYKNRNLLKDDIEKRGGKVAGSVSSNTDYLINNDANSKSSKNETAKKLNIPIISEKEFIEKFLL